MLCSRVVPSGSVARMVTGHGVWHLLNGLVVWQFYCIFRVHLPPGEPA